ncbi:hypothetical protein WA026_021088 [Henosepilachna vigintioctopunctata]|uniref:Uncharacterized protein n=1 Tax=Henosepilachna vigintioctopunctata TaxID=420089 RepID=A0AAW1V2K7_9CUCU
MPSKEDSSGLSKDIKNNTNIYKAGVALIPFTQIQTVDSNEYKTIVQYGKIRTQLNLLNWDSIVNNENINEAIVDFIDTIKNRMMKNTKRAREQDVVIIASAQEIRSQRFGPASILQDSRLEPKVDGTFGFLYRTEDGITSAARGNSDGKIQGRFTYTDPTGLKVNFNYNAGSRRAPGYINQGPEDDGTYDPKKYENPNQNLQPQSVYQNVPQTPNRKYSSRYTSPDLPEVEPQPEYNPLPPAVSADIYQQRRSRPPTHRTNEVYDQPRNIRPQYDDRY